MTYLETALTQARSLSPNTRSLARYLRAQRIMPPSREELKTIRRQMGMNRPEFAKAFLLKLNTYRDWELERSSPTRAAAMLLRLIVHDPHAMLELTDRMKERHGMCVKAPTPQALARLRNTLNLSHLYFTTLFNLCHSTYCEWELGRGTPGYAASLLLRLVETDPKRMAAMTAGLA